MTFPDSGLPCKNPLFKHYGSFSHYKYPWNCPINHYYPLLTIIFPLFPLFSHCFPIIFPYSHYFPSSDSPWSIKKNIISQYLPFLKSPWNRWSQAAPSVSSSLFGAAPKARYIYPRWYYVVVSSIYYMISYLYILCSSSLSQHLTKMIIECSRIW